MELAYIFELTDNCFKTDEIWTNFLSLFNEEGILINFIYQIIRLKNKYKIKATNCKPTINCVLIFADYYLI